MKAVYIFLIALFCIFMNLPLSSANCTTNKNQIFGEPRSQEEEFGPLQIAIADLTDALNSLEEGNKKLAVVLVKSAKGQLRKISQLNKTMVKGMTARLNKAISAIKRNDFDTAISEMTHVRDELSLSSF